jgi:AcrR family transcriptional regulator
VTSTSFDNPAHVATRRERARTATITEIKDVALRLMREQGTTDVRFSDIARAMGMTPPALYRYFGDSEELLTALIVDAYDALGAAVAEAREAVDPDDITGRMLAVGRAYRRWARDEPQRFALILGMPVPGYCAPESGPTTEAAQRAMAQLKAIFADAAERGVLGPPLPGPAGRALAACMAEASAEKPAGDVAVPADTMQAMLHVWAGLHGFTSLETYGHFDWLSEDARDEVFDSLGLFLGRAAGLPLPAPEPAAR